MPAASVLEIARSQPTPAGTAFGWSSLDSVILRRWDATISGSVTVISDLVSSWVDQRNAHALTHGTPANRPGYFASGFPGNGGAYFKFDGSNDRLFSTTMTGLPVDSDPVEVWALCEIDVDAATTGTQFVVSYGDNDNGDNRGVGRGVTGGFSRPLVRGGNGTAAYTEFHPTNFLPGAAVLLRGKIEADKLTIYRDKVPSTPVARTLAGTVASAITVGGAPEGGSPFNGKLQKVLITSVLTDGQARAIEKLIYGVG